MTPHVMKRDGCKVPFKSERIKEAILRAAKAAGVDDADYCATVAEVVSSQMNERSRRYQRDPDSGGKPADVWPVQTTRPCVHRISPRP